MTPCDRIANRVLVRREIQRTVAERQLCSRNFCCKCRPGGRWPLDRHHIRR